jgi:predicted phage tail protein
MSNKDWIRGAGGGGSSAPVEDDDTLFSDSKARVIDLVSEGEIVGLLNAKESIYLNETPLQDSAGNSNFDDVTYKTRLGTNSQLHIPGFVGTEAEVGVGILVTKEPPAAIIRTFSSTTVDAVRVLLFSPALLDGDNDAGDLHGSEVEFKIWLEKDNDGYWEESISDSFNGKTSAKYERTYRIDIPWASFSTISIKVERITDDATSTKVQNELYFGSYTKVIDNKLRYPNSAIIATQVDARQFTAIPNRAYEIKGVKIKVPSNYTPYDPGHCDLSGYRRQDRCEDAGGNWLGTSVGDTLYSGSWDGTFDIAWTCNPAWILYDLCTDDRYGLGKWLSASQMDKWSLYEIGKYCDAVDNSGNFIGVSNGWKNFEARFACNLYLQGREEAFKVLNDIASCFRGMIYWQQGQVSSVQDAPKDPIMNFSDANVIEGTFTYEGTSRKQRHNVAHVTWNNPDDFYRQNVEYVEDAPGILNANNQIFSTDVVAVGCTSQGQARRVGKWILYTERYETETVTFSTGLEGAAIRPGDIIKVADSHKAGIRYGGRIAAGSTTTTIKLDAPTSVTAAKTYTLSIINTEEACVQSGVKQSIAALSCSNVSYSTEDTCLQSSGTCSGGTATGSEDYDACICITDATWTPTNTWTSPQSICLNANVANEWKPFVWVETKNVDTIGTTEAVTEITVTSAFTNTPATNLMWILEEMGSVEAQDFRVLMTRESGPNIVEVSALKYHEAKYGLIEEDIAFSPKSTSSLPNPSDPIPSPSNLTINEELYVDSMGNVKNRAEFSWDAPKTAGTATTYPYIASYYVEWRRKAPAITNWTSMGETSAQSIIIDDAPAGTLEFRVKTRRIF